jgi:predicted amidohydrolase
MAEIVVATCTYRGSYELAVNLKQHHAAIDEAAGAGASLLVLPEISLHGYPPLSELTGTRRAGSLNPTAEQLFATAERVPDGPSVSELVAHAADRDIHVVFGLNEAGDQPGVVYNTAVLCGPEGFIGAYRKVHVHALESVVWRKGNDFPVFQTAIGTIGIMICYDKWWPESARELTLRGADVLVAPAAWFGPEETGEPQHVSNHSFCLYDEVRALESSRWVVSSNYVGDLGGYACGGLSRVVDPMGRVVATTGCHEGLALATIDVRLGILQAAASMRGARLIRDRRPETYKVLRGELPVAIDG